MLTCSAPSGGKDTHTNRTTEQTSPSAWGDWAAQLPPPKKAPQQFAAPPDIQQKGSFPHQGVRGLLAPVQTGHESAPPAQQNAWAPDRNLVLATHIQAQKFSRSVLLPAIQGISRLTLSPTPLEASSLQCWQPRQIHPASRQRAALCHLP